MNAIKMRLKFASSVNMGQSPSSEECNKDGQGIPFLQGNAEFGAISPQAVQYCVNSPKVSAKNSILLSVRAPVGAINIADQDYGIGRGLCGITVDERYTETKFLYYLLLANRHQLYKIATGSTYDAVSREDVANLELVFPQVNLQKSIARFLDRKTAVIDTLIAKKQRLIQLLEEKRTALINQAVTKGLNPKAPMKDSGSDWIGETPAHWEVRQLKYLCILQRGFDLPSQERKEGHYPIYGGGGITGYHNTAMVKAPGIVTGRYGTVGEVYLVEEPFWPLNTSLYVKEFWGNSPTFIKYLLSVIPIKSYSAKSAVPGVDRNDLHIIPVARPPREEQDLIVQYLEQASDYKQRMTETIERQIEKLQEYRRSLITAAVTGKLDINNLNQET